MECTSGITKDAECEQEWTQSQRGRSDRAAFVPHHPPALSSLPLTYHDKEPRLCFKKHNNYLYFSMDSNKPVIFFFFLKKSMNKTNPVTIGNAFPS